MTVGCGVELARLECGGRRTGIPTRLSERSAGIPLVLDVEPVVEAKLPRRDRQTRFNRNISPSPSGLSPPYSPGTANSPDARLVIANLHGPSQRAALLKHPQTAITWHSMMLTGGWGSLGALTRTATRVPRGDSANRCDSRDGTWLNVRFGASSKPGHQASTPPMLQRPEAERTAEKRDHGVRFWAFGLLPLAYKRGRALACLRQHWLYTPIVVGNEPSPRISSLSRSSPPPNSESSFAAPTARFPTPPAEKRRQARIGVRARRARQPTGGNAVLSSFNKSRG